MGISQELLWGHAEDLLIAGAQQQPSPDTAVPLTHPQRRCKDQHRGQSRWPLTCSQSGCPAEKPQEITCFPPGFFFSCFLRRRTIKRIGNPCQTPFLGNNRILKKHMQDPEPQSCFLLVLPRAFLPQHLLEAPAGAEEESDLLLPLHPSFLPAYSAWTTTLLSPFSFQEVATLPLLASHA